jgi:hypothetical protein
MTKTSLRDNDAGKGAVEQDRPEQKTNMAAPEEQLDHRDQDVLNKMNDTDYPEHGQHGEHSGQVQGKNQFDEDTTAGDDCAPKGSRRDPDGNAEGELQDMDPGQEQKRNQGGKKDDDLAA